jgi:hypothetical protein
MRELSPKNISFTVKNVNNSENNGVVCNCDENEINNYL